MIADRKHCFTKKQIKMFPPNSGDTNSHKHSQTSALTTSRWARKNALSGCPSIVPFTSQWWGLKKGKTEECRSISDHGYTAGVKRRTEVECCVCMCVQGGVGWVGWRLTSDARVWRRVSRWRVLSLDVGWAWDTVDVHFSPESESHSECQSVSPFLHLFFVLPILVSITHCLTDKTTPWCLQFCLCNYDNHLSQEITSQCKTSGTKKLPRNKTYKHNQLPLYFTMAMALKHFFQYQRQLKPKTPRTMMRALAALPSKLSVNFKTGGYSGPWHSTPIWNSYIRLTLQVLEFVYLKINQPNLPHSEGSQETLYDIDNQNVTTVILLSECQCSILLVQGMWYQCRVSNSNEQIHKDRSFLMNSSMDFLLVVKFSTCPSKSADSP